LFFTVTYTKSLQFGLLCLAAAVCVFWYPGKRDSIIHIADGAFDDAVIFAPPKRISYTFICFHMPLLYL